MVGSVLLKRMHKMDDFAGIEARFFSSSSSGQATQILDFGTLELLDANDLRALSQCQIILSCQGSAYTREIHPQLRQSGWCGYWLDAASHLRASPTACLCLDPVNLPQIQEALRSGCRDFVGANCTVSLLLLAVWGLIRNEEIKWIKTDTYQAISGAGARALNQLIEDTHQVSSLAKNQSSTLEQVAILQQQSHGTDGSLRPFDIQAWIDEADTDGQTKEERKSNDEAQKILGPLAPRIAASCVRVPALRSHAQSLTIKLRRSMDIAEITEQLATAHPWVKVISNTEEATKQSLTPMAVSHSLDIRIGRLRKLDLETNMISLHTAGDQLLWGAAEPLRRMLQILVQKDLKTSRHDAFEISG